MSSTIAGGLGKSQAASRPCRYDASFSDSAKLDLRSPPFLVISSDDDGRRLDEGVGAPDCQRSVSAAPLSGPIKPQRGISHRMQGAKPWPSRDQAPAG